MFLRVLERGTAELRESSQSFQKCANPDAKAPVHPNRLWVKALALRSRGPSIGLAGKRIPGLSGKTIPGPAGKNRPNIFNPPAPCAGIPMKSCARVRRCVVDPCGPRIEDVHGFRIEDCVDCFVLYVIYLCNLALEGPSPHQLEKKI